MSGSRSVGDAAAGLEALGRRLAHDLECLQLPAPRWTPATERDGRPVHDVAIVGGGMAGIALAGALGFVGVGAVVVDESPAGFEGPWATTARMQTLRSPKQLAGPALGIASLTFRAWFEAQFGAAAWDALDKIPRLQWMDYLRWLRGALAVELRNGSRVVDVRPRADGVVELDVEAAAGPAAPLLARHVVLATGRAGLGGAAVPGFVRALPRSRWAHSSDDLDAARLRGLRVAVIGFGASAMDSAATALEAGAAEVRLLARRAVVPRINKGKGAGHPGFVHGYAGLPDAWKRRLRRYLAEQQVPPPRGSVLRVARHPNAHFHVGCGVERVEPQPGGALRLHTTRGALDADFVIAATGFEIDWAQRPMLARLAPHVRRWRDRAGPCAERDADGIDGEAAAAPDLGPAFEFRPRDAAAAAACPGLERVHCFAYPAAMSRGVVTGDIPAISDGALALARALAARLYAQDVDVHFARLQAYDEPELLGDEWRETPLPAQADDAAARRVGERA